MIVEKTFRDGHKQISHSERTIDELIAAQKKRYEVHKLKNYTLDYRITKILKEDGTIDTTNTTKFENGTKLEVDQYAL